MNNVFKKEERYTFAILLVILLVALALRVAGAWISYPLITHPDEPALVGRAARIVSTGNLNPEFFNYPSLVIYIQVAVRYALVAATKVFYGAGAASIPEVNFYVAGRIVASVAATLSVLMVYLTARRLFSVSAGLFAAAVVAVCPLHVDNSAMVTVDIWVAVFAAFVLYFCAKIYEKGEFNDYILAGACVGLATGSKYTGAVFFIGIVAAHFMRHATLRGALLDVKKPALAALATAAYFIATTPYALLDFKRFLAHVAYESRHYRRGHSGYEAVGNHRWDLYADFLLSDAGLGIVFLVLALASVVLVLRSIRTGGGIVPFS